MLVYHTLKRGVEAELPLRLESHAWEASALPLSYTRVQPYSTRLSGCLTNFQNHHSEAMGMIARRHAPSLASERAFLHQSPASFMIVQIQSLLTIRAESVCVKSISQFNGANRHNTGGAQPFAVFE